MYIAAGVLVVLWLLDLMVTNIMGSWVHVLLAVAVILVLVQMFGKKDGEQPNPSV